MNKRSIQILRGTVNYDPRTSDVVLEEGQPFYSYMLSRLYVGDGTTPLSQLNSVSLLYDEIPTEGSTNNITSGALYEALQTLAPDTQFEIVGDTLHISNSDVTLNYNPLRNYTFKMQRSTPAEHYAKFTLDEYTVFYPSGPPTPIFVQIKNPYYPNPNFPGEVAEFIVNQHVKIGDQFTNIGLAHYATATVTISESPYFSSAAVIEVMFYDPVGELSNLNTVELECTFLTYKNFIVNDLNHQSSDQICALSAHQGYVLNNKIVEIQDGLQNFITQDTFTTQTENLQTQINNLQQQLDDGLPVEYVGF